MHDFFHLLIDSRGLFLHATLLTLKLTIIALLFALVLGLIFALLKLTKIKPLEWISDVYVWIVRGTPLLVQISVIYFGMTGLFLIPSFWAVAIALAFHNGAYIAEIFRGSIQSIDDGQREAGRSLGMTGPLTMRRIILPQAFRRAVPPLANQFIIALKDSSLASFIGMQELFGVAQTLGSNNYDYMPYYLIVSIYYLVLVLVLTLVVRWIEKKMATSD